MRISYLQSQESDHGLIALFEINSKNLDKNEPFEKPTIQYGQSVIVLNTKDHEKIYQVLKRKGYEFLVEPTVYEKRGTVSILKPVFIRKCLFMITMDFSSTLLNITDSIYL